MISVIAPRGVVGIESAGGDGGGPLLPEEEAALGRATPGRRREFAVGRNCCRQALARLGIPAAPILRGPRREPVWPPGIVGSLTHCPGYWAVAIAKATAVAALGVDVELNEPLPAGVFEVIATPEERSLIDADSRTGIFRDRLLFSAKESVYKAWFPLTGTWLGFQDVVLTVEPAARSFSARLAASAPAWQAGIVAALRGRYVVESERILTLVTAEAPAFS